MLRALLATSLLTVLLPGLWAADGPPAGDAKASAPAPAVDLRFLDGSSARAVILQESLEIETRYGKLTVPCAEIRKVELSLRLDEDTTRRIAEAVQNLGSAEFAQREAAGKELLRLPIPAYQALKSAPPSKDPEAARRAEALLKQIESAVPAARLKVRAEDLVQARDFTIPGKITARTLRVKNRHFGETEIKLGELAAWEVVAGAVRDVTAPFAEDAGIARAAYLFEQGDFLAAQESAKAFAKGKAVEELARHFRNRKHKGLGIGPRPDEIKPDGIELMLCRMDQQPPLPNDFYDRYAAELARAFYLTAAIGEGHRYHCPVPNKQGKKDPKDWDRFSVEVRDNALSLAEALKQKQYDRARVLGKQLNHSCVSCHEIFRDCS